MTIKQRDELVDGLFVILHRFHDHPWEVPREEMVEWIERLVEVVEEGAKSVLSGQLHGTSPGGREGAAEGATGK